MGGVTMAARSVCGVRGQTRTEGDGFPENLSTPRYSCPHSRGLCRESQEGDSRQSGTRLFAQLRLRSEYAGECVSAQIDFFICYME